MSGGLERLGESREWGDSLLRLLEVGGWTVDRRPAALERGVLVIASKNGHEVRDSAETLAEVAGRVFEAAIRVQRLELRAPVQLQLL